MPKTDSVLVPREPTEEMLRTGMAACGDHAGDMYDPLRLTAIYRAMLSAIEEKEG